MFTETLVTIAKIWNKFSCQSTEELVKKIWKIHPRLLFSYKGMK